MTDVATAARALIAPDKFKGSFGAGEVAMAIAAGLRGDADLCPIADGGEGTAEVLLGALGGRWVESRASDALGRPVSCRFALLDDGVTAVVEVAEASGLWRLGAGELDPLGATSRGTGELLSAARAAGAQRILLACGGSATSDGGRGALEEFSPRPGEIVCLCDTDITIADAARVYGPQKGAGPAHLPELETRLRRWSRELPSDPSRLPCTGAAGGLAGGLWAHGARLVPGAREVLKALDFDARLRRVDLLVTGEGRLDATSLRGKGVGEVMRRASAAGVPVHAIVGVDGREGNRSVWSFASVAEAGTLAAVEQAAASLPSAEV